MAHFNLKECIINMTNKEAKIQLALGILPEKEFYELASSSDPKLLKALAKAFSEQIIDDKSRADNITTTFINNPHMTQKLKNFILLSRMLHSNVERFFNMPKSREEIKKKFDELSKELFDD